jgi:SAM-dependent methyltransferase
MTVYRNLEAEGGNREHWDELAEVHFGSYDLAPLLDGGHCLDPIQVAEVGDVSGKRLLHLQCHIGHDTLSWARLGALVTGVDISPLSVGKARELAHRAGLEGRFLVSSVYDLEQQLDERFDIVYTSMGVLCWLSDLREWARIIEHRLEPGGFFYIFESHPAIHVFDDECPEGLHVRYPYFHSREPVRWDDEGPDYSDGDYIVKTPSWEWTWGMGDVVNSLIDAGLRIEFLHEHDVVAWKVVESMVKCDDGWWRLKGGYPSLPLMFSILARRD